MKTVIFIHDMYISPLCWEGWVKKFESTGYRYHFMLGQPGREEVADYCIEWISKQGM